MRPRPPPSGVLRRRFCSALSYTRRRWELSSCCDKPRFPRPLVLSGSHKYEQRYPLYWRMRFTAGSYVATWCHMQLALWWVITQVLQLRILYCTVLYCRVYNRTFSKRKKHSSPYRLLWEFLVIYKKRISEPMFSFQTGMFWDPESKTNKGVRPVNNSRLF